jgi:ABC-type transport system involved in multi-copper enzyme maturation permease subunit
MTQLIAIFLDGYRDLAARKLFWITLILSGVVMAGFGLLGINNGELYFLWFHIDVPIAQYFYDSIFAYVVMGVWLTWVAIGLALISTAGIFPDLLVSGTIDLYLARPIGRLRFFLIKYASGLLFVALQVGVFSLASFVVLGIRGHQWRPSLFLAIPVVLCFFSYIYCVCVVLGVWTRSTIAALLLTILFWGFCSLLYQANAGVLMFRNQTELTASFSGRAEDLAEARHWATADRALQATQTVFPKIKPTINLLDRWMFPETTFSRMSGNEQDPHRDADFINELHRRDGTAVSAIGSSLIFEAVVLAVAAWIFCRRDY